MCTSDFASTSAGHPRMRYSRSRLVEELVLRKRRLPVLVGLVTTCLVLSDVSPPRAQTSPLRTFLETDLGLDADDLARALDGHVVATTLDTEEPREIIVFGSMIVNVPRTFFVERIRDIEWMREGGSTLQLGRFGPQPNVGDLRGLDLPRDEIDSLRACRVGNCEVQLSAQAIRQLRTEVRWAAPYYAGQAMAIFRRMLTDYVQIYAEGGNHALIEYHDQRLPLRLREEIEDTLVRWPFLASLFPVLNRHLASYPESDRAAFEDSLYWALDSFGGLKPVVSITHASIHDPSPRHFVDTVVAAKQIYASHYLDASLGLTMLVDRHTSDPSVQVLYLNRSRSGFLKRRVFGGLARGFVRRRVRGTTEDYLRRTKRRLEEDYRAARQ